MKGIRKEAVVAWCEKLAWHFVGESKEKYDQTLDSRGPRCKPRTPRVRSSSAVFKQPSLVSVLSPSIRANVKIKVTLEQAKKAHTGSRDIPLLFLLPQG